MINITTALHFIHHFAFIIHHFLCLCCVLERFSNEWAVRRDCLESRLQAEGLAAEGCRLKAGL